MSDFFINSFSVTPPLPVVTGGTLTSDATYYYRTFTNTSTTGATTDTLSIANSSLNFDYVLVGGGGSVPSSPLVLGTMGTNQNMLGMGSGGAGGVSSGSMTLNPNNYSIRLGGVGTGKLKGYDSYAFNDALCSRGGGSGGTNGAWYQAAAALDSATNEQGTFPNGTTNNIVGSGGGYPTGQTQGIRQFPYLGQGNMGGFVYNYTGNTAYGPYWNTIKARVEANYPGYTWNFNYSCYFYWNNGYFLPQANAGCVEGMTSGGGAGAVGFGLDTQGYAMGWYQNTAGYYTTGWETSTTYPTSGFTFSGGSITGVTNAAGAGVTILGLTVGQNGDLPNFRRTTALTTANTGCGGGFTHGPGTGVLRIRYLRSAVGG